MKKLLIIGAGGHGHVIADIAINMKKYSYIAFLDDRDTIKTNIDIIGKVTEAYKYIENYELFVAIGDNHMRENIQCQLKAMGADIPVLIHPSAIIANNVSIGMGTVIMAGVVINWGSIIGKSCIINTSASIDHDNVLEDYVHISPGVHLAGTVTIGKSAWVGIGAIISNNLNICSGCTIGAGAVVVNDIVEPGTYMGVPAKYINKIYKP